jgi:hypothetical protein
MAPVGPDQPGAPLPAPYRSPWRALASDLVAVGADLGLRGRELLRRSRQGDLPYPRFWPASLAAGFWPLVVVGVLALVGSGLGGWPGRVFPRGRLQRLQPPSRRSGPLVRGPALAPARAQALRRLDFRSRLVQPQSPSCRWGLGREIVGSRLPTGRQAKFPSPGLGSPSSRRPFLGQQGA